jgi:hypothetical protein
MGGAGVVTAPVSERYVTAGELAELMGVSVRSINRMVLAGMPSETWGMARTRRFLPSEAIAWAQSPPVRAVPRSDAIRDKMERVNDDRLGRRANAPGPNQRR